MRNPIRIAVTGPESTGKSTLSEQLAMHYGALWVPEAARDYLSRIQRDYTYNDILEIARLQINNEDKALSESEMIFADTELLVTKIWCEVKYGSCHPFILDELQRRKYDLVLLCNIDLPWEFDPLREHPDKREYLMNIYRKQVHEYYDQVVEISGIGNIRLQAAVTAVENIK